ncbi:MAG: hypothetical protein H6Q55_3986, partial [Deltaproteobacteria bacterium]|nr:hypothetical protein [Deltaproteobacteria bacterium]
ETKTLKRKRVTGLCVLNADPLVVHAVGV